MNTMIEMYDRIMSVVEEVTGISKDKILTSNCEECVDARHILVYILGNRSFSDNKIAELLMNMQTIVSGLIQVLTPILTPGSAPIQSPNLGGDVPAEEKPKAEEAPNKK